MIEPVEARGWEGLMSLPMSVYSNLVSLFYCNLEVETLDNVEFTIDTTVIGKDIVLTPSILFNIIGAPNIGDNTFIDKPSTLDMLAHKSMLYKEISIRGSVGASITKEFKKK